MSGFFYFLKNCDCNCKLLLLLLLLLHIQKPLVGI